MTELMREPPGNYDWVSVKDRLPILVPHVHVFEQLRVLISDGHIVACGYFNAGNGGADGRSWADWSDYNDIQPKNITHWMPMPGLPK